jgi:hypothetical protein
VISTPRKRLNPSPMIHTQLDKEECAQLKKLFKLPTRAKEKKLPLLNKSATKFFPSMEFSESLGHYL